MKKDVGRPGGLSSATEPQASRPLRASIPDARALKIWWIPQVPMEPFEVAVPDLATASAVLDVLADYDAFQFRNNVKGDYCNTGGLMVLRDDGEWEDWEDDDCAEFDEWRDENLPKLVTNGWCDRDLTAQAIEARRAETGTGSVHESAVGNADAPDTPIHPERETDR